MSRAEPTACSFTPQERQLIRHEMGQHFGEYPRLADGIILRTWHAGERKGQPNILLAIAEHVDARLGRDPAWAALAGRVLHEAGIGELRQLLVARRFMDPTASPTCGVSSELIRSR